MLASKVERSQARSRKHVVRRSFRLVFFLSTASLAACHLVLDLEERNGDGREPERERDAGSDTLSARDAAPDVGSFADATVVDAGGDAACDPSKPFGTPSLLVGPNTVNGEFGATLSFDELEIFFTTTTPGNRLVHRATRPTRSAAFGPAAVVDELRSIPPPHWSVSLNADGTAIYVTASGPPRDVYRAIRPSPEEPFKAPARVVFPGWDSGVPEEHVFVGARGHVYLTVQSGPQFDLFVAPPGDAGENRTPVSLIFFNTPVGNEAWPVEAPDGLRFYYATGNASTSDILESRRDALTVPFPVGTSLSFPMTAQKHPLWASPDNCRLYLMQDNAPGGAGGADLWVATRPL